MALISNKLKNRKVLLQYSLRYGTVMLLVACLLMGLINWVLQQYRTDLIFNNKEKLSEQLQTLDKCIIKQEDIAREMYLNQLSSPHQMLKNSLKAQDGINQIILYQKTMEINDYIVMYYGEEEVFASNGEMSLMTLSERLLKLKSSSQTLLLEKIQDHSQSGMEVLEDKNGKCIFVYFYPMLNSLTDSEDMICFIIREERLKEYLQSKLQYNSMYAIMVGEKGELLFEINGLENTTEKETELLKVKLLCEDKKLPGNYSYYCYSFDNGLNIYCALQEDMLLASFNRLFIRALLLCLLIFAMAFCVLNTFNRLHVRNIESIRDDLLNCSSNSNFNEKNEFLQIRHLIRDIYREKESGNKVSMQLIHILCSGLIKHEESLEELVLHSCPQLKSPYYVVLSAVAINQGKRVIQALTGEEPFDLFVVEQYQDATIIFFVVGLCDPSEQNCREMAKRLLQRAQEQELFDVFITVGRVCTQLSEIGVSYEWLLPIVYHQLSDGAVQRQKIILFEAVVKEGLSTFFTAQDEQRVMYVLADGEVDDVGRSACELIKCIDGSESVIFQSFLRILFIHLLEKCMLQLGVSMKLVERLKRLPITDDEAYLGGVASIIKKSRAERELPIEMVLQYIDTHYKDNTLGLEALAARFQMSIPTISRYIKEQTGQNYTDYISRIRLQEACRLLRDTDIKIQDVPNEIGYKDYVSFSKKFKAAIGVSPSQYRKEKE